MKPWIKFISYEKSKNNLRTIYNRVKDSQDRIDNILMIHSLRPHTLEAHMKLYKNILHHNNNTLPKWLLETLGVFVSFLNRCDYCVKHHFAGLKRILKDEKRSDAIWEAIEQDDIDNYFQGRELALMRYAKALTLDPGHLGEKFVVNLRETGLNDGEILEANQLISYFSYANRTVLGLGVSTDGDILGLSPSDSSDPDNWVHH
ncbi:MAG: hypothetical protein HeimC3_18100 [Candidatus Heimdallarchaeota archaeon LC_3]|nr:MAG: hypothetical protein HeimC3_18100 [Candidatus Heimdallarchaeota archaeon LC_3]